MPIRDTSLGLGNPEDSGVELGNPVNPLLEALLGPAPVKPQPVPLSPLPPNPNDQVLPPVKDMVETAAAPVPPKPVEAPVAQAATDPVAKEALTKMETAPQIAKDPSEYAQLNSMKDALAKASAQLTDGQDLYARKMNELSTQFDEAKKNLGTQELIEKFANAFGLMASGYYGLKTGTDMSGVKFDKTDWERKLDQEQQTLTGKAALAGAEHRATQEKAQSDIKAAEATMNAQHQMSVEDSRRQYENALLALQQSSKAAAADERNQAKQAAMLEARAKLMYATEQSNIAKELADVNKIATAFQSNPKIDKSDMQMQLLGRAAGYSKEQLNSLIDSSMPWMFGRDEAAKQLIADLKTQAVDRLKSRSDSLTQRLSTGTLVQGGVTQPTQAAPITPEAKQAEMRRRGLIK